MTCELLLPIVVSMPLSAHPVPAGPPHWSSTGATRLPPASIHRIVHFAHHRSKNGVFARMGWQEQTSVDAYRFGGQRRKV